MENTIILTGGGTAGHVCVNIKFAKELKINTLAKLFILVQLMELKKTLLANEQTMNLNKLQLLSLKEKKY